MGAFVYAMKVNTYLGKTTEERFWEKVKKRPNGCWEWQGCQTRGYGFISISGQMRLVHRFSYWIHNKNLPKGNGWHGVCVCHKCDNRKCVNPKHLFLGSHLENMQDAMKKGKFNKEGHPLSKNSKERADKIRKLYRTGKYSQRELGKLFGVSHTNIYAINKGQLWKS